MSILTTECHKSGRCSNAVEVPRGTGVSQRTNGPLFKGKLVSKLYFFSEGFFIYNLKIFTILFLVLELPKTTLEKISFSTKLQGILFPFFGIIWRVLITRKIADVLFDPKNGENDRFLVQRHLIEDFGAF